MRKMIMAAVAAVMITGTAAAGIPEPMQTVTGKIVKIEPINTRVQTTRPVKECTSRDVPVIKKSHEGTATGTILGAIVGGVVGNQIGGGSGRDVATGVGVIVGAATGNELSKDNHIEYQTRHTCSYSDRVEWITKQTGWMVYVKVNGQLLPFVWNMPGGPYVGQQVNIGVEYNIVH